MSKILESKEITLDRAKVLYEEGGAGREFILEYYTREELVAPEVIEKEKNLAELKEMFMDICSKIIDYNKDIDDDNTSTLGIEKISGPAKAKDVLSKLIIQANEGWEPNWRDKRKVKYCIEREEDEISLRDTYTVYSFLAFKEYGIREKFLKDHEDLIKTYLMIDGRFKSISKLWNSLLGSMC